MLTHVYDQVTETEFFITKIVLADEKPSNDGDGTSYGIDLVSYPDDYNDTIEILNVPLVYVEKENSYYMADISEPIMWLEDRGAEIYNYDSYNDNPDMNKKIFKAKYSNGQLLNEGATYTEPHTSVSIYQANKEPITQEATTIRGIKRSK